MQAVSPSVTRLSLARQGLRHFFFLPKLRAVRIPDAWDGKAQDLALTQEPPSLARLPGGRVRLEVEREVLHAVHVPVQRRDERLPEQCEPAQRAVVEVRAQK